MGRMDCFGLEWVDGLCGAGLGGGVGGGVGEGWAGGGGIVELGAVVLVSRVQMMTLLSFRLD